LSAFTAVLAGLMSPVGTATDTAGLDLITLSEGTPDAPLILSLNQPFLYFNLARHLPDNLRCANLHISDPGLLDRGTPQALDRIVEQAVTLIRAEAAGAPVILLGQCIDGVLAYRVAQAMAKTGHGPDVLGMIDSWAPDAGTEMSATWRRILRLKGRIARWVQYGNQRLRGRIGWREFFSKSALGKKILIRLGHMEPTTKAELREWRTNAFLVETLKHGDIGSYAGDVMLFRTASQTKRAVTDMFGWKGRIPDDTAMFALPGWHEDALMKNATGYITGILAARATRLRADPPPVAPLTQDWTAGHRYGNRS